MTNCAVPRDAKHRGSASRLQCKAGTQYRSPRTVLRTRPRRDGPVVDAGANLTSTQFVMTLRRIAQRGRRGDRNLNGIRLLDEVLLHRAGRIADGRRNPIASPGHVESDRESQTIATALTSRLVRQFRCAGANDHPSTDITIESIATPRPPQLQPASDVPPYNR